MAELKLYTQALLYLDGTKLAECESIQVSGDSKAQIVETIAQGLSGITQGASQLKFTVKNAVPDADFEMNPNTFIKKGDFKDLSVFAAGKTITSKVFINNWSFSYQVNGKAELNFDAIGTWSDWE